jgi:hypothetical protein
MTPGNEAAAEGGQMKSGVSASPRGRPLGREPDDRYAGVGRPLITCPDRCTVDDLRRLGRHVERAVLARAVGWHLEDRVIVHQNSTIVFS